MSELPPAAAAAASPETGRRAIVGWEAGTPVYDDAARPAEASATPAPRGTAWLLRPGDIVCDWLKVEAADSRGLLRLFVNLTIYAKIAALIAFFAS